MKIEHNRVVLITRSAVFWVWSIINTLVVGPIVLIGRLFSYDLSAYISHIWLHGNLWGLKLICGVSWKVEGCEHLPDHPCLAMAKHQSTWDAYFVPTLLPRSVYVAKKSLAYIPIFGWALAALNFILIDRSSGRSALTQMVEQSKERFASGISVMIFPEGTRMPVGAEPNYRIGGGMIAAKTGVNVLPIAINAGEFWPRQSFIKWPGEITVAIGPVIETEGKSADQITMETQEWIEGRMAEMTILDRFPY